MTCINPSEWRVTANPVSGTMLYSVYRIRNVDEIDHSGNREYSGPWFDTRDEAEQLAKILNESGK